MDWLVQYASDQWEQLKQLGQMLWDSTQPVRDALAAAWDWLKGVIGIGGGEDGQGGILGWITEKAGEVWAGIMEAISRSSGRCRR